MKVPKPNTAFTPASASAMEGSDKSPQGADVEKVAVQVPEVLPGYNENPTSKGAAATVSEEDFYTRNGLNLNSFKMRDYGVGIVELDRAMKRRHLHMIAIGGSIGTGFFVGSGSALMKGVSRARRSRFQRRQLPFPCGQC